MAFTTTWTRAALLLACCAAAHAQQQQQQCSAQMVLQVRSACPSENADVPSSCSASCGKTFVPFYESCEESFDHSGSLEAFYHKCGGEARGSQGAARSRACCEKHPRWKGKAANTPVCGFSPKPNGQCITRANKAQAESACKSVGGRLCTLKELLDGCGSLSDSVSNRRLTVLLMPVCNC